MQQQMKHSTRLMSLYYGRNHSSLTLNRDVEVTVLTAMYQSQATMIKSAVSTDRFMAASLERKELLINLLSAKDIKELTTMAKKGTIAFRENYLGGCMKGGVCEYGGTESIARCAGGDGGKPCHDAMYDREKEPRLRADLRRLTEEIKQLPVGSPRYNQRVIERQGLENVLHAIST